MAQYLQHSAQALNDAITRVRNNYKDVSWVTATGADVLEGKVIVDALGAQVTGTLTTEVIKAEGYEEGYEAGETAGYNQGVTDATEGLDIEALLSAI